MILAMTESSGIWRKASGTWTLVNGQIGGGAQASFSWVPGSSVVYFYDHSAGVWRSTDAGQTWVNIWAQPSTFDLTGYVAADPRDPSRLYVSVGRVGLFRLDGATVGTVGTGEIVPQPVGVFLAPGPIAVRSDGAVHAVDLASALGGPDLRVSTDMGVTWSSIADAYYLATGGFVRSLSVGPDAAVWAGMNSNGVLSRPSPSYDLNVTTAGAGSVSSTPAGIACPPTCSVPFGWGTPVMLTANPGLGSTFTGWSGAGCSGTATCQVVMTQTASVTATFAANARPDAQLSIGNGSFVGNNVYNVTGAGQTFALRQPRGTTRTFRVRVQNDGGAPSRWSSPAREAPPGSSSPTSWAPRTSRHA